MSGEALQLVGEDSDREEGYLVGFKRDDLRPGIGCQVVPASIRVGGIRGAIALQFGLEGIRQFGLGNRTFVGVEQLVTVVQS